MNYSSQTAALSSGNFDHMLGQELRSARLDAGLTQEALAAKAKISREYLNQIEHDKKSPTVAVFLRVCRGMNVSAGQLLMRVEKHKR